MPLLAPLPLPLLPDVPDEPAVPPDIPDDEPVVPPDIPDDEPVVPPDIPDDEPVDPLDMPDEEPVDPFDPPEPVVPPGVPEELDGRVDPLVEFVVRPLLEVPGAVSRADWRACSRARHASSWPLGASLHNVIASSVRLAGMRLPVVVPDVVAPEDMPLDPLLPDALPDVPPVCAVAAIAVPSATATASAFNCIIAMLSLLVEVKLRDRSGSRRFHAPPECAAPQRFVIGLSSLRM